MCNVICITNRKLCAGDFLTRIARIAEAGPAAIVLREKDLSEAEYEALAEAVLTICRRYAAPCILHGFPEAAARLHAKALHLPLWQLQTLPADMRAQFSALGASCHSAQDAQLAASLGCRYITAGHVFATGCKKDLPPRGLAFLQEVCRAVSIPVFAIGGIGPENAACAAKAGAAGVCVMSGLMRCADPAEYLASFKKETEHA